MATKTVTIDTGEWIYLDSLGDPHTVTNAQTFTFELTDGGAALVDYAMDEAQTVTTTDGYTLYIRKQTEAGGTARKIEPLADALDGAVHHNLGGEIVIECPVSGIKQIWKVDEVTVDDVDAPTSITNLKLTDQFGNTMTLPSTGSGITVA